MLNNPAPWCGRVSRTPAMRCLPTRYEGRARYQRDPGVHRVAQLRRSGDWELIVGYFAGPVRQSTQFFMWESG
ncbi:hypothetical protein IEQ34_019055 [Dendrobium chrysotoxum]|uniref:Uncharacterized protein n=1 Tax=Dendrobium chrysotoxum TaxID=161865 RepID=A0AAV7G5T1_DENCH|nr:hypothetical protein IEQ34_019055 [Dendrobium chrysotoxum]